MSKYRDPLLRSASDLQGRLYNIVELQFLGKYYHSNTIDKQYAVNNSLYVIAEYFGWVEVLRREVQFLDLGSIEANRRLEQLLETISRAFLSDRIDPTLRLFRGEQRAIGEIMLQPRQYASQGVQFDCIGYATFVTKLNDPDFARWFTKIQNDIQKLADGLPNAGQRLIRIQHALIDLVDFLDPENIRVPERNRRKIERSS